MAPRNSAVGNVESTPPPTTEKSTKEESVKAELGGIQRAFAWFQCEETSLLTKISVLAVAFFAVLTLGSLTGKIAISFIAAAVVVGGSYIWAATKGVLEPKSKETPEKVQPAKKELSSEELHRKFIEVLEKSTCKYDDFPRLDLKGPYTEKSVRPPAHEYKSGITRGKDTTGCDLVTLKLQVRADKTGLVTTFVRRSGGFWLVPAYPPDLFSQDTINNESQERVFATVEALVTGSHPKYSLAPLTQVSG